MKDSIRKENAAGWHGLLPSWHSNLYTTSLLRASLQGIVHCMKISGIVIYMLISMERKVNIQTLGSHTHSVIPVWSRKTQIGRP